MQTPTDDEAGHWVQELSWPAVAARLARGALAVLPIGAASKEHGPHLPHGTDYFQACHYAERIAAHQDALLWPVVSYGYYPVFTEYPGSVSLARATFRAVIDDILDGMVEAGATRIALLNTGISTIGPLEEALAARSLSPALRLLNCYHGPRFAAARAGLEAQPFGGHADEIETALMLAINPQRVHMARAVAATQPLVRGRFNRRDASAANYSPSGVNGDPTLATRAKGETLLAALVEDLRAELEDFLRA